MDYGDFIATHYVNVVGFLAAGLVVATLSMRTMIPLRIVGIASNIAFVAYGILYASPPTVILHSILFPLNVYRLHEMRKLIGQVKEAARGDLSLDWLKPFMTSRPVEAGQIMFRKGDEANHMYFVVSGQLRLHEIDLDVLPGAVVGELGMLAPARVRTMTLECIRPGMLLEISYDRIEELYFQNPKFGFYFLRLSAERLFDNIERSERARAEQSREIRELRAAIARTA